VADWPVSIPRIVGIHQPPLGPWPHWSNDVLPYGRLKFTREDAYAPFRGKRHDESDKEYNERLQFARGATTTVQTTTAGQGKETNKRIYEHALKARRWKSDEIEGQEADYGSFARNRGELVKLLREKKFHLVFSGHIHCGNLLIVDIESMVNVEGKSQKQ